MPQICVGRMTYPATVKDAGSCTQHATAAGGELAQYGISGYYTVSAEGSGRPHPGLPVTIYMPGKMPRCEDNGCGMVRAASSLFGMLAIKAGLVTSGQVEECLRLQESMREAGGAVPRLGEVMCLRGYLSPEQVQAIIRGDFAERGKQFGELCVAMNFSTCEQVEECLAEQEQLRHGGRGERLGKLLVGRGYLKEGLVPIVLGLQGLEIAECTKCRLAYNVSVNSSPADLKCSRCGLDLIVVTACDDMGLGDVAESAPPGLQSGAGGAGRKLPGLQSGAGGAGRKLPGKPVSPLPPAAPAAAPAPPGHPRPQATTAPATRARAAGRPRPYTSPPAVVMSTAANYFAGQGGLGPAEFLTKTKVATMKLLHHLDGASALGAYLVEGAVDGAAEDTYKARVVWDQRDESKRAMCFRTMGTRNGDQHEVWLTLWTRDPAETQAIENEVLRAPVWKEREGVAGERTYGCGSIVLGFNEEASMLSLIYREEREVPFTGEEYCGRLGLLFDELASLLDQAAMAPPAPAEAPAPPARPDGIVVEDVSIDELMGTPTQPTPPVTIPTAQAQSPESVRPPGETPEPPPELPVLGKFRGLERIGRDVLGVLYRAEHVETRKIVALKVIDEVHARDPDFAQHFMKNAKAAARLKHPNLKRIIAAGRVEGHPYYASEFVEGRSAHMLVEDEGRMSLPEAGRVIRAVAEGLRYAHAGGVLHGDIRPSHIIVSSGGGVKLAETGVSGNIRDGVERLLQDLGCTFADALVQNKLRGQVQQLLRDRCVTALFMAPEVCGSHGTADARTDIYGLGAAYYYMVTWLPPFSGTPPLRMLMGMDGAATAPRALNRDLPLDVNLLIQKMMAPDPAERHQTVAELIEDLDKTVAGT